MKKILKNIASAIARVISIIPESLFNNISSFQDYCYTGILESRFLSAGHENILRYPIKIIGGQYINLGNNVSIGKHSTLSAWSNYRGNLFNPLLYIDSNVNIGEFSHISTCNSIRIGKGVLIGRFVSIIDNSHGDNIDYSLPPEYRPLFSKGEIIIEENVWIGDKVTILSGVHIGKNTVVGANSVVTKSFPPNSLVAGTPAKLITKK